MTNAGAEKIELGVIPDAVEVFGHRYKAFAKLAEELKGINEAKSQLEKEAKDLNTKLIKLWADCPAKTVLEGGAKVTLVSFERGTIDKQLLMENGVEASTIIKSTKMTPVQFVKITPAKES
jgi:hypothetical protein